MRTGEGAGRAARPCRCCKIVTVAIFTVPIVRVGVETPRNRIVRVRCPEGPLPFQAGQYVSLGDHEPDSHVLPQTRSVKLLHSVFLSG